MIKGLYKQILLCVFLLAPLSLTAAPFNKLVIFGDSLSDSGNLASIPGYGFLNQPPYQHGFNNGAPAVEQLAKLLNLPLIPSLYLSGGVFGNNFAVAGARAGGDTVIDLNTQVAAFLVSQGGSVPDDTLYVIFIGGNDIRDMRNQTNEKAAHIILDKAITNVANTLSQLLDAGATHFLVVNSPDIGKIPETKALATEDHNLIRRASQKTLAYNKRLAETVQHVKKRKGGAFVLFDLLTFFNGIAGNGKAYHFFNTNEACYSSAFFGYYPICDSTNMDSFLYFDEIHPTQRVHERLGRALFSVVPEAN
ncbi:MAG: SGNH/GDSL hydrolase family protein [Methyloglobulus sp.]|nr:SGNH/GDSL hydrolase family protein [Methyloglobulus sp.]